MAASCAPNRLEPRIHTGTFARPRHRLNRLPGLQIAEQRLQLDDVVREGVAASGERRRARSELVGPGCAAEAEIDAARKQRRQRAELLGDTSGAWFGSMIPPDPTRIRRVPPAIWPIATAVAALAMPSML